MSRKNAISQFQLTFLLIQAQIGVGFVTLPFDVYKTAKEDAWISILLTGAVMQITILLFWGLMKRFPSSNLYHIVQTFFGKRLGSFVIILYGVYFVVIGIVLLDKYSNILKTWMMPLTPRWLLIFLLTITAIFIVLEYLQTMARFFVLTSVTLVAFLGMLAYSFKNANLTFILPIGSHGALPIIQGILPSIFAYQGFAIVLIMHSFVKTNKKGVLAAASIANVFVTFFYLIAVMTSLLFFSPDEIKLLSEPVFYIMKAFSFKIIERPDLLFVSMWIVLVATSYMNILYVASLAVSTVFGFSKFRLFVLIIAGISLLLAIFINPNSNRSLLPENIDYLAFPFGFGIPILLLLLSIILKRKERVNAN